MNFKESKSGPESGSESSGILPYRETKLGDFHLLVGEKEPGLYRRYVGKDGERFCHYDSGHFQSLEEAYEAALEGFDAGAFLLFSVAPFARQQVLKEAPVDGRVKMYQ